MRTAHHATSLALACLTAVMLAGCVGDADTKKMAQVFAGSGGNPDELPVMTNKQPPFRYPTAAYAKKIQGNTILRIFIDANGNVLADSTTVAEPSGTTALDSAAIVGARELHFVPAKKNGQPHGHLHPLSRVLAPSRCAAAARGHDPQSQPNPMTSSARDSAVSLRQQDRRRRAQPPPVRVDPRDDRLDAADPPERG